MAAHQEQHNQTLRLRDGRLLGFAEWGSPDGLPVFFFSGTNGARKFRHPDESIDSSLGIHLYTFDRPGLGLSDPQPGRTLLNWAEDVRDFADQRHIDRFALVATSLGGPYGAACAYALPDRLSRLMLVSAVSPLDTPELYAAQSLQGKSLIFMGRRAPWAFAGFLNLMRPSALKPDAQPLLPRTLGNMPPADREVLSQPGMSAMLVADQHEALRQNGQGVAHDVRLGVTDWGFRLEEITTPTHIWQGEADGNAPPIMGRTFHERLSDSQLTLIPGAGHMLILSAWRDVFAELSTANS
jgi:pimeloyl-ACP methyl ester carboxylesterase